MPRGQTAQLAGADLIILPGTKSTLADLRWLRESGTEAQTSRRTRQARRFSASAVATR